MKTFDVVAINDVNPSSENLAYLLNYDSIYGRLDTQVEGANDAIRFNGRDEIPVYHQSRISDVPWEKMGVDVVVDASGIIDNLKCARALKPRGIKNCVVTHSPDNVDKTIILGVNEQSLNPREDFLISSSICDANAFSPTMHVLHQRFGIEHGFLTTLHPWLGYQNLLDGPSRSFAYPGIIHKNFALGRASTEALIPKPTSCITASSRVLRYLADKFQSLSYRVPTPIVSSADVSVKLTRVATRKTVIEAFQDEEQKQAFPVFCNNFEELVSSDFIGTENSAIIDHRWTEVNTNNYLKLVLWYDNEWGYSARTVDLVGYIGKLIGQTRAPAHV